jgi:hypothetical protein
MKKTVLIVILAFFAISTLVFAGAIAQGKVSAIDGNNVTFEFIKHDMAAGDQIQMGFGAVGKVIAVDGNNVTVEFSRKYRQLEKKLKDQTRVQAENGGSQGKFTPGGMKGC